MIKRVTAFLVTIVLVLMCAAAVSAEELPYVRTVFNERSGLPTGEANDVLQTADGYVWVGSYGGLIRYDGSEFRNFSTEGILPSSSVRMLFEDSAGRLWIGTNDAGVFVYENGSITQPDGQPRDTFLCVRGFAESADGVIYACSNSGIAEINGGVMRVYDVPELSGQTVYSVAADKFGRVWGAKAPAAARCFRAASLFRSFLGIPFSGTANLSTALRRVLTETYGWAARAIR